MSMSIWMRSNAYAPKVGIAPSGSVSKIAEGSVNAWQAESTYSCAAVKVVLPSDQVYIIENTSVNASEQGAFGMYLTQGPTASVDAGFTGSLYSITANSVVSSPIAKRMFIPSTTQAASTNLYAYTASLQVFNSVTYVKEQDYTGPGFALSDGAGNLIGRSGSRYIVDVAYNSVDDQVYVLTGEQDQLDSGGAVGLRRGYLDIWNSSGSVLVESHSLGDFFWGIAQFFGGYLVYNRDRNHMLINPTNNGLGVSALSYSIFDCATKTVVHSALPAGRYSNGCYASASGYYYLPATVWPNAAIKINVNNFTESATNITNSWILSYFPDLGDVIVGNGGAYQDNFVPVTIFDGATESASVTIPGIFDSETQCTYDPCQKCLVFSDDAAGDIGYGAGGQSWVYSGSWEPKNFFVNGGAWYATFDAATSTVWCTNYSTFQVDVIRTGVPTASIQLPPYSPPPQAPPVPQNLRVQSGSAILTWEKSGSGVVDYYSIFKSTTSEAGPYTQITTSLITRSVDTDVAAVNSYWYKVNATVGAATSSFTNIAELDVIPCNSASFQPIIHQGYINYATGSTYKNVYGKIIKLSVPTYLSASMWLRSPDFDACLTIADASQTVISSSIYDGWTPTGDVNYNAALTYNFPSGTYDIEVSSVDNAIGRYNLIISPGSTLECTWSNAYETATTDFIPTGNTVAIGEQGANIVFFLEDTKEVKVHTYATAQGARYSPIQDRTFGWVYEGNGTVGWTASIVEFDNTGSQVAATRYPRPKTVNSNGSTLSQTGNTIFLHPAGDITDFTTQAESGSRIWFNNQSTQGYITSIANATTASVNISQEIPYDPDFFDFGTEFQITRPQITPNVDYSGYLCYDGKNDRILFYEYNAGGVQFANVFDCATRTITASLNLTPVNPGFGSAWESCYSWIDDTYYIGLTGTNKMIKVHASNYTLATSSVVGKIVVSYLSASNLVMHRNTAGKVQFYSPISDSVVHAMTDLPTMGYFECGGVSDKCSNTYLAAIDPRSGEGDVTNHPCLAIIDRNTYLPVNYIMLTNDSPGGFSPDGWYQYSMAVSDETSKVYSSCVDYDTYTGRLYSTIPTTAYYVEQSPYQATAADTASCIRFKQQYKITGSLSGSGTTGFVCSTKKTGSATLAISNFEIDLGIGGFPWHNYGTWFMTADGSQTLATYTGSYIHTLNGKNAVHCYGKYYMLDDGTQYQVSWYPTSASNVLVFDNSGSYLTTIALPAPARDFDTDGENVYVMCHDNYLTMSVIDPTTDTISQTQGLIVDYSWTPATLSPTASASQPSGLKQYPMFGRYITPDGTYFYMNCIGNIGNPGHAADTFAYLAGGWGGYTGQYLDMMANNFTGFQGGVAKCPLTNTMFWGAQHTSSYCIIETTMNLGIVRTFDISYPISTIVYNPRNRTMELFSDIEAGPGTNNGAIYVYDPIARTNVCGFWATNNVGGPSGGNGTDGNGGYNIDVNIRNGDIYFPQRIDSGSASPATGSIKVYQI